MRTTRATAEPVSTQPGQQFDAPLHMTKAWARVVGLFSVAAVALVIGVAFAVMTGEAAAAGAGAVIALPFAAFGWLMAWYTKRTERMVYPAAAKQPVILGEPTVVFVRDRVKTRGGYVDKDPEPVDIGLPPREAVRVLRWMQTQGKTSRRTVCDGTGISQGAWSKLDKALHGFGILDGGGLTDEVDNLIAQLESQL